MADPLDPAAGPVVPGVDKSILDTIKPGKATYGNIDTTVRGLTQLPGLTETILPSIKALLQPGDNNPYAQLIDKSTAGNVASAQTDAMRRGLSGSDIEAAGMAGARAEGESQKTAFYTQNAQQMAGFMKDLATGDINDQRENLMMFAQLMGQKITSDQDLQMFREQLAANMDMASKSNKAALWGAGIGAVGQIGGGLASKYSDERLKVGIRKVGKAGGLDIYKYRWSKVAQLNGAHDRVEVGVLAQEVERIYPSAAGEKNGFKTVDYGMLPLTVLNEVNRLSAGA